MDDNFMYNTILFCIINKVKRSREFFYLFFIVTINTIDYNIFEGLNNCYYTHFRDLKTQGSEICFILCRKSSAIYRTRTHALLKEKDVFDHSY